MIPIYTRWSNREAFWIRTRTPVSDQLEPLVVVDILDDPFGDTLETVHDLPERVVRCGTCPGGTPGTQRGAGAGLPADDVLAMFDDPAATGRRWAEDQDDRVAESAP